MRIVFGNRHEGKTLALIHMSSKTNSYMVVLSRNEAQRVFRLATNLGIDIHYPITFDEFINGQYHSSGVSGFMIDNADMLLQAISRGVDVKAISVTDDVQEEQWYSSEAQP